MPTASVSMWGKTGDLPTIAAEVYAVTAPLGYGAIEDTGAFPNGDSRWAYGHDANPAEVVYDLLCNPFGRCGIDEALIDSTSFSTAAATLESEGAGFSGVLANPQEAVQYLQAIMAQIAGVLYQDMSDGLIKLKLMRSGDTSVATFGPSEIESIRWRSGSWRNTHNTLHLNYTSRARDYDRDASITDQDDALVSEYGVHEQSVSYPYVCTEAQAKRLLARDLKMASIPIGGGTITLNRAAADVNPGDVITLNYPEHHLVGVECRVMRKHPGTLADGRIQLDVIEDVFAVDYDGNGDGWQDPPAALPATSITNREVIELPKGIARKIYPDYDRPRLLYLAERAGADENFDADVSVLNANDFETDRPEMRFAARFQVHTAYARDAEPYDTTVGLRIKNLTAGYTPPDGGSEIDIRSYGDPLLLVGGELLHYESVTDNGDDTWTFNNVWRNAMDTAAVAHPVDEVGWIIVAEDHAGETVFGSSEALEVRMPASSLWSHQSDDDVESYNIKTNNRPPRPYPAGDLQLDGTKVDDILQEWQTWTWLRRRDDLSVYYRPDDSDDRMDATGSHSAVTYNQQARIVGDGAYQPIVDESDWADINVDIDAASQITSYESLGHGDYDLRLVSHRTWLFGSFDTSSYQAPTLRLHLARYRQLLRNPTFTEGVDFKDGWTFTGFATAGTGMSADYRGIGGLGSSQNWQGEEIIDVEAMKPEGLIARLRYYVLNTDADDTFDVQIYALDASMATLDSHARGDTSPGTSSFTAYTDELRLPAGTKYVKVIIKSDAVGEFDTSAGVIFSGLDFRLGDMGAELVTNGGFNSATTGWTVESGTWSVGSSSPAEGAGYLQCAATGAAVIHQEFTPAQGYMTRGTLHTRFLARYTSDALRMLVEVRTSSGTLVNVGQWDIDATLADGNWRFYDVFLDVADDTADHVRVTFQQITNASGANDCNIDDVRCVMFKELHPTDTWQVALWDNTPEQSWPTTTYAWANDYGTTSPETIHLFNGAAADTTIDNEIPTAVPSFTRLSLIGDAVLGGAFAGARSGSAYSSKGCLYVPGESGTAGSGAQFAQLASLSCDGSQIWTATVAFRLWPTQWHNYILSSQNFDTTEYGWSVQWDNVSEQLTLTVSGSGGTHTGSLSGAGYADGTIHYVTVQYNGATDSITMWTELEQLGAALTVETGSDNSVNVVVGGAAGFESPDIQIGYLATWGDVTNAKADIDAWWTHGSDPSALLSAYTMSHSGHGRVDSDADGEVVGAYATNQYPIFQNTNLSTYGTRGLSTHKAHTNFVQDYYLSGLWSTDGSPTITERSGMDASRMQRAIQIAGTNTDFLRTNLFTPGGSGTVGVVFWARAATAHNMRVTLQDDTGTEATHHDFVITTTWAKYSYQFVWAGPTAQARMCFAGSDTGSSQTVEIHPIMGVYFDSVVLDLPNVVMWTGGGACSASHPQVDLSLTHFIYEGEIAVTALCDSNVPDVGQTVMNVNNGSDDHDRRLLWVDGGGDMSCRLYGSTGTYDFASASSAISDWDYEWTGRLRWNWGDLMNGTTQEGQVHGEQSGTVATGTAWGDGGWSGDGASPLSSFDLMHLDGANELSGLVARVEIASRERPL